MSKRLRTFLTVITHIMKFSLNLGTFIKNFQTNKYSLERSSPKELEYYKNIFLRNFSENSDIKTLTGQAGDDDTKNVEIMVTLRYLSNLEMSVISCESCVIVATAAANQAATFSITDTKLYVLVVTLSTQNNTKLLKK